MKNINTYKLFESLTLKEKFQGEVNDYLIDLTDNKYNIETAFFQSMDVYVYVCNITNEKYTFTWSEIKNDISRYVEMSKFKLVKIRVESVIHKGDYEPESLSKISDEEKMGSIKLYFTYR